MAKWRDGWCFIMAAGMVGCRPFDTAPATDTPAQSTDVTEKPSVDAGTGASTASSGLPFDAGPPVPTDAGAAPFDAGATPTDAGATSKLANAAQCTSSLQCKSGCCYPWTSYDGFHWAYYCTTEFDVEEYGDLNGIGWDPRACYP
jgi:hypothetical protein